MSERFLVTGAMGCLGSWAVKRLVAEGVAVTTFDIDHNPYRMRLIEPLRVFRRLFSLSHAAMAGSSSLA